MRSCGVPREKCASPQTHRYAPRYTIAHLFRARPCNRSYVTEEEAVCLPWNYEHDHPDYAQTWHELRITPSRSRDSLSRIARDPRPRASVSRGKFNFRGRVEIREESERVLPWIDDDSAVYISRASKRILNASCAGMHSLPERDFCSSL